MYCPVRGRGQNLTSWPSILSATFQHWGEERIKCLRELCFFIFISQFLKQPNYPGASNNMLKASTERKKKSHHQFIKSQHSVPTYCQKLEARKKSLKYYFPFTVKVSVCEIATRNLKELVPVSERRACLPRCHSAKAVPPRPHPPVKLSSYCDV